MNHRRGLLLSLLTLLALTAGPAAGAWAASAPAGLTLQTGVGRSVPLSSVLVGSQPLRSGITSRVAAHGYDRIAVATGVAAEEGLGDAATTAARIHGNSASSPATSYLYRLTNGRTGEYLKTGISKNPFSRYSGPFMQDKEMEILTSGSRREMLNLERFIVERDAGPLNREPWAGRYANDVPGAP